MLERRRLKLRPLSELITFYGTLTHLSRDVVYMIQRLDVLKLSLQTLENVGSPECRNYCLETIAPGPAAPGGRWSSRFRSFTGVEAMDESAPRSAPSNHEVSFSIIDENVFVSPPGSEDCV